MKNNSRGYRLEYSYEQLSQMLQDATAKVNSGKLDLDEKLYGIAAGYAQDFVDTSRAIKKPLDLTSRTEDNVFMTLMRVCAENQAQGKSVMDNKTDMAKKFGNYQLFAVVNSMNCEGKTVEIAVQQGLLMAEPKLVIRSLSDGNGKTYTFDVLAAAKTAIDGLSVLDPKQNDGAILFGKLSPFYQQLQRDLLDHLEQKPN